jgi:hypothetical protein
LNKLPFKAVAGERAEEADDAGGLVAQDDKAQNIVITSGELG